MRSILTSLILGFTIIFSSCSTDIDIAADWKETTVVYGILSKNDSVHYLRISKAYLDPKTSAYKMADIYDSLYYKALTAKVQQLKFNVNANEYQFEKEFVLTEDHSIPKQSGTFAGPDQPLYTFEAKLDPTKKYKLIVISAAGNEVSSETFIVGDFVLSLPFKQIPLNLSTSNTQVSFNPPSNGFIQDMTARLHYTEYNPLNPVATNVFKYVDYTIYKNRLYYDGPSATYKSTMDGLAISNYLASQVKEDPSLRRQVKGVEFIINFGAEDLATYINVNSPSTSIVQERPQYSNIKNGVGLFSSRIQIPLNFRNDSINQHYYDNSSTFRQIGNIDSLQIKYPLLNFVK